MTEFELIQQLTRGLPRTAKDLVKGVGDDCAAIRVKGDRCLLVTTDALIEDIHFKNNWQNFESLGAKALAVNLSDIAAMGGRPRFFLVSIGLPPQKAGSAAKKIYSGMLKLAARHKVILIGGDTVASPKALVISITVIGEASQNKVLYRNGARPGDAIYVSGTLGESAFGLECLKAGRRGKIFSPFIIRHLLPSPKVALAKKLAGLRILTSMIDVSDGFLADLGHIADESNVGYKVDAKKLPVEKNLFEAAGKIGANALDLALSGGEDYELIFTVRAGKISAFEKYVGKTKDKMTRVGVITSNKRERIVLNAGGNKAKVRRSGFDHFGAKHL